MCQASAKMEAHPEGEFGGCGGWALSRPGGNLGFRDLEAVGPKPTSGDFVGLCGPRGVFRV